MIITAPWLLKSMDVAQPQRLVVMWPQFRDTAGEFSYNAYLELSRQSATFDHVALSGSANWPVPVDILLPDGRRTRATQCAVSDTFFDVPRTSGNPRALIPTVAVMLSNIDPQLTAADVTTMADVVDRVRAPWRFNMLLFGVAATDSRTLIMVASGVLAFGVLASYLPARRAATLDPSRVFREE